MTFSPDHTLERLAMNTNEAISRCTDILTSSEWLGVGDGHTEADAQLDNVITEIYLDGEHMVVNAALDKLGAGYLQTTITDRLCLVQSLELLEDYENETFDIDGDDYQAMLDNGDIEELTPEQASQIIKQAGTQ